MEENRADIDYYKEIDYQNSLNPFNFIDLDFIWNKVSTMSSRSQKLVFLNERLSRSGFLQGIKTFKDLGEQAPPELYGMYNSYYGHSISEKDKLDPQVQYGIMQSKAYFMVKEAIDKLDSRGEITKHDLTLVAPLDFPKLLKKGYFLNFKDAFRTEKHYNIAIRVAVDGVVGNTEKTVQVFNIEMQYLHSRKKPLVAWYKALVATGFFKRRISYTNLSELLNNEFYFDDPMSINCDCIQRTNPSKLIAPFVDALNELKSKHKI